MIIHILPNDENVKSFYVNHSNYYPGDAGLDIFTPETIVVPPRGMGKVVTGISCGVLVTIWKRDYHIICIHVHLL